jgi:DNA-binding NtrC family response regulator
MSNQIEIVVVDDNVEMGQVVTDLLSEEGYRVKYFTSAYDALLFFKQNVPHVLITDLKMKDIDGMAFLKKMQTNYSEVVTIMMTAFGSIETAIEAMKTGAYHYITKPFKNTEMILLVKRAFEKSMLHQENKILRTELHRSFSFESIVGKSPAITSVFELIKLISPASANVLITGESGSGKELIARALHNSGPRKNKSFIPVNCSAIPAELLESELFGHMKGSFTGAIADKKGLFREANEGTLFLDEIGDLSLPLQAKLLRVLQDKQVRAVGDSQMRNVDVRIVSATHRDLKAMVKEGKFREDLFYRLNVIPIRVPALRERMEDIPLLVDSFIQKFATRNNIAPKIISPDILSIIMSYSWPGNVRELENIIERAMILSSGNTIDKAAILHGASEEVETKVNELYHDRPTLDQLEERYIKMILTGVNNKKDEAAKLLGINRRTLYRKEKTYGMSFPNDSVIGDEDGELNEFL